MPSRPRVLRLSLDAINTERGNLHTQKEALTKHLKDLRAQLEALSERELLLVRRISKYFRRV
jgi:hypothetical protein